MPALGGGSRLLGGKPRRVLIRLAPLRRRNASENRVGSQVSIIRLGKSMRGGGGGASARCLDCRGTRVHTEAGSMLPGGEVYKDCQEVRGHRSRP